MSYVQHISEVGCAIFIGRGTYSTEEHFHVAQTTLEVCGKMQPAGTMIFYNHIRKVRFVDRDYAISQIINFLLVYVNASYIDAHLCEARTGDQPNVTCPYYRYIHILTRILFTPWQTKRLFNRTRSA